MELLSNTYFAFFAIIAIGIALGNIKIKGISLDLSAIIFVALAFGHFGVKMPIIFQQIGLILFIFSVGIQAGPGFFQSFKKQGLKLISLALIVSISAALITILSAYIFDIDFNIATGLFAGALTSTSGLAAAIESTNSPMASIGFGMAYPFGVIGIILFARLSPNIFRVNIKKEEEKFEEEIHSDYPNLINKNFIIENINIFEKNLEELQLRTISNTNISKIMHNNEIFYPTPKTVLNKNDIIRACGTEEDLEKLTYILGPETQKEIPVSKKIKIRKFLVTNKTVIAKSLGELNLLNNYNATVTAIRRSGIDITPKANSRLRFGDKLTIALPEENLHKLENLFGDSREKLDELNFLPIAIGILIGILLGQIEIPLWKDFTFKLGLTGGVLISALILSNIGKTGNIVWNISGTSNQFLRRLGLMFFLATVGTNAGEQLLATLQENGSKLLFVGALITIIPMVLTMIIGKLLFKINFLTLVGGLTGSMTSTPALSAVEPITKTNAPQIAYATVYPFALVMIIILSQILGKLQF
jgi:putative transport protein